MQGDFNAAEEELTRFLEPFTQNPAPLVEWKNHAARARLLAARRRPAAAREAWSRSAGIVRSVAMAITDSELRDIFLSTTAVRQVLAEAGQLKASGL
jgi:hypothetical protein